MVRRSFFQSKGIALTLLLCSPLVSVTLFATEVKTAETILAKLQPLVLEQRIDGIEHSIDLHIQFALNSAVLQDDALPQLQALAAALRSEALAHCTFYLVGHTDSSGNAEANMNLSKERASAVRFWLLQQEGLHDSHINSTGVGATQLLPGISKGSNAHRRVEVRLADANACQIQQGLRREADGELSIKW